MGLSVHVGILADLKANDEEGFEGTRTVLEDLAARLAARGIERHVEPEDLADEAIQGWDMVGYSGLHHLRLVAARATITVNIGEPVEDPDYDRSVDAYHARFGSKPSWWSRLRGRRTAPSFEH